MRRERWRGERPMQCRFLIRAAALDEPPRSERQGGFAVKQAIIRVSLVVLLLQGLVRAEQTSPYQPIPAKPAPAATLPVPKVAAPAPVTSCCPTTCHGAWRDRFMQ